MEVNKFSKRLVSAAILALVTSSSVFAQPSQSSGNNPKEKAGNIEMSIEKLDAQIEDVMKKIEENKKQVVKTQKDINNTQNELNKAEKDIQTEKNLFGKRMRVMYINGVDGYINMFLDSKGIGELISRVDAVKRIIQFDNKIIANYKGKQEAIKKKKDGLVEENDKLNSLKVDNEKKLADLNKNKDEQKRLLAEAKEQERLYVSLDDQNLVNSALKQVNGIRRVAPKVSLSRGASSLSSNNVIAYASNFLGTPYVWGGTSPNPGFDCSGFTQYVYGHFGVSLGRTTYDQINDGVGVSRDQLQPGDLVFFGTRSNPHHMGIYVGNGAYIHAPHTGDVIKVSTLGRGDYLTARRVQ